MSKNEKPKAKNEKRITKNEKRKTNNEKRITKNEKRKTNQLHIALRDANNYQREKNTPI